RDHGLQGDPGPQTAQVHQGPAVDGQAQRRGEASGRVDCPGRGGRRRPQRQQRRWRGRPAALWSTSQARQDAAGKALCRQNEKAARCTARL
ncbi:hypothetical protein LPJ56_006997, partial [Coemansia sp. RSA 2599]